MTLGDNCRSGCRTRDHSTWGECARRSQLKVGWAASASGLDKTADRQFDRELQSYADARADGIQPAATTRAAVREAYRVSELTGTAYNGETMPPTALLPNKRVAEAAQEAGQM